MPKSEFITASGVVIIVNEDARIEDNFQVHDVAITVFKHGDWQLHVMSEEDVADTYELELQYQRPLETDFHDYPEDVNALPDVFVSDPNIY